MKSIKLRNGQIMITETPEPQITSPTQVKIKISYSSICGYEMMCYKGLSTGGSDGNLGHEASGVIVETGRDVSCLRKGDRVSLSPYYACGTCENCRKGLRNYCLNASSSPTPFMAEYVVLDQQQAFRLPDILSLLDGCLVEPLSVAIRAIEKANLGYAKKLLIIGGGAMGLITLQAALTHPIDNVVLLDPNPSKRALAIKLGASLTLDPYSEDLYYHLMDHSDGMGYDAVIEASGNSESVTIGFNVLARGGSLVLLSLYETDFQLPIRPLSLYWKDATIQAVYPDGDLFASAVHLAQRLSLSSIVTGVYPYTQARKAFEEKATSHMHAKVVLDFTL